VDSQKPRRPYSRQLGAMEVAVLEAWGIGSDAILSMRAGAVRRQAPIVTDKPFCFPCLALNASPLNIDVLKRLTSGRVNITGVENTYSIVFPVDPQFADPMGLTLRVTGMPEKCGCAGLARADQQIAVALNERKASSVTGGHRAYLERFNLLECVQEMLQSVLREKPEDPYTFMAGYLQKASSGRVAVAAHPPPPPPIVEEDQVDAVEEEEGEEEEEEDSATVRLVLQESDSEVQPSHSAVQAGAATAVRRDTLMLEAQIARLRDEIDQRLGQLQEPCPEDRPGDDNVSRAAGPLVGLACQNEELRARQRELHESNRCMRQQEEDIRRTLSSFCDGLVELTGRLTQGAANLGSAVDSASTTPAPAARPDTTRSSLDKLVSSNV